MLKIVFRSLYHLRPIHYPLQPINFYEKFTYKFIFFINFILYNIKNLISDTLIEDILSTLKFDLIVAFLWRLSPASLLVIEYTNLFVYLLPLLTIYYFLERGSTDLHLSVFLVRILFLNISLLSSLSAFSESNFEFLIKSI